MEDSFELLEQKVQQAATRLRELQAENKGLRAELQAAQAEAESVRGERQAAVARVEKAEQALRTAGARTGAGTGGRAETAEHELAVLRRERDELRKRIVRLVELLGSLE